MYIFKVIDWLLTENECFPTLEAPCVSTLLLLSYAIEVMLWVSETDEHKHINIIILNKDLNICIPAYTLGIMMYIVKTV